MSGGRNAHIKWSPNPSRIAEEAQRMEREDAFHVVRVIYNEIEDDDAVVYREGRMGLKHQ